MCRVVTIDVHRTNFISMRLIGFSFLSFFIALFAGVSEAEACTCSESRTVLDEYSRTPIVVAVRLERFEELDRSVADNNVYRTQAAVMAVEKSYKGALKAGQVMRILDGGGGECTRSFAREKVTQRFLIYTTSARRIGNLRGPLYLINSCSRSIRIEEAAPDLTFLDNRTKFTGQTRLSGSIKRFSPDPPSLAGIKVTVSGNDVSRVVETNEHGFFEFWGLPAGQYEVAFSVPNGTRIGAYRFTPADRTWRRESPPNNTIRTLIGARKHLELTVGLDRHRSMGH